MNLLPREIDKLLLLHQAGFLAQKRLARGLLLNLTEATALIATVLQELARDGKHSVAELMSIGKQVLGRAQVQPTVPYLLHEIQIEATFPDGVFLVTVHSPICSFSPKNLELALYSSFLPLPPKGTFLENEEEEQLVKKEDLPGAIVCRGEEIVINKGRERVRLQVTNTGDRPIQVGSHFHFTETNKALSFDREKSFFKRLDIPAGTAVRFEPGDTKTVTLVQIAGHQLVTGGNNLINTSSALITSTATSQIMSNLISRGFLHDPSSFSVPSSDPSFIAPYSLSRESYASMFGPTVGDRIKLGDTSLWIEIEKDFTTYGDELKFGGGKTVREGMGQKTGVQDEDSLDLVITNALIIDWNGIYKADLGIKKGKIVGIGKAGNEDVMEGVTEGMIVGVNTEVVAGEKLILTAGAIDAHVHYICPQLCEEALASGITTLIGGGTGPTAGSKATTCTPSQTYIRTMMRATDTVAMNFAFTGKANDSAQVGLVEQVKFGCAGLKLHEDWGTTPSTIDTALSVADQYDIQINIHSDTLNEAGFVEDTIAAFKGRTIHTYHTEGAGGGHAPDLAIVVHEKNVLPSSTNPTRPFSKNTLDEHLDMLMVCHHLDRSIPEDIAFAESRIRGETVAAEDVLQDMGAISMISSDSQAMGRIGEVISRTWRTASKMRECVGPLKEEKIDGVDNERVKRYIAKYAINPAITHGISHLVGDIAPGKLADLVLWTPANFGVRPEMVIKGGVVAWANMGDANASIPTVEPVIGRPMWGTHSKVAAQNSMLFVSQLSIDSGTIATYGLEKRVEAVKNCRNISKLSHKNNTALPDMTIDPESYRVEADGVHCTVPPATEVALAKNYMLF
ncbi:hypothetical protein JCM3765_006204 [Sporobolomyces pararoseus]